MVAKKPIVASREYKVGSQTIKAVIYQPVRMKSPPRDWIAEFEIEGLAEEAGKAIGVDTLQAILLATQGLRVRIEALGAKVRFLGRVGDSGIPRLITTSYGLEFARRAERLVDEEATRFVEAALIERTKGKGRPRRG